MIATPATSLPMPLFEVRYASLFDPGRVLSFPCDCAGHVDLDALSERARVNYLFARSMVGREHAMPCICQAGSSEPWQRH